MPYNFYGRFSQNDPSEDKNNSPFSNDEDREFEEFIVKDAKKTHSKIFGALALYTVLAYVLINLLVLGMYFLTPNIYAVLFKDALGSYLLNAAVMYLICLPVFYLMVRKLETRKPWRQKMRIKEFVEILAVSQVLMTVGNNIGVFFNSTIGKLIGRNVTNTTAQMIGESDIWMLIVFSVILAPIAEELLMRKLLIDRLSKYGSGFALVVSAVAFGLFHGNFYQFFYAFLVGLVLGCLYIRAGLIYSILLHMIINFTGSVLASLYVDAAEAILNAKVPEEIPSAAAVTVTLYSVFTIGLFIYGIYVIFTKFRRREFNFRALKDARLPIPKGSFGRAVFANAGMILFLAVSALNMLLSLFM